MHRLFPLLIASAISTFSQAADLPAALPLWPHGAPGSESRVSEPEKMDGSNVTNVHQFRVAYGASLNSSMESGTAFAWVVSCPVTLTMTARNSSCSPLKATFACSVASGS